MEIAQISDVGMRRASNQDNMSVLLASGLERWRETGNLFLVADGMGAHAAGELASEIAADKIPYLYSKFLNGSPAEALREAVAEGNAEIHRKGQANEDFYNMGTTCSVLGILPEGAIAAHVGDSRIYRLRDNQLEQLTFDHSLVWEMKAAGSLSAEDERSNMVPRNVITRSLGPYPEIKIDLEGPFPVRAGDVFLLCSDGLTGQVSDDELGPILASLPAREAARVLVDLANLRGGPDNITLIIVRIVSEQVATTREKTVRRIRARGESGLAGLMAGLSLIFALIGTIMWWASGSLIPATIPWVLAVAGFVWTLVDIFRKGSDNQGLRTERRLGRGPYTKTNAASGKEIIEKLQSITAELQKAARSGNWAIDWEKMGRFVEKANQSTNERQFSMAVRCYCRSISFLMEQLRQQGGRESGETGIDL